MIKMNIEHIQLLEIVEQLSDDDKKRVKYAVEEIEKVLTDYKEAGFLALALVGTKHSE
jgi:hypothetical protein